MTVECNIKHRSELFFLLSLLWSDLIVLFCSSRFSFCLGPELAVYSTQHYRPGPEFHKASVRVLFSEMFISWLWLHWPALPFWCSSAVQSAIQPIICNYCVAFTPKFDKWIAETPTLWTFSIFFLKNNKQSCLCIISYSCSVRQ